MANDTGFNVDYLRDILPYEPQPAFYSSAPFGGGFSPASQQYWAGQYGNVMNQYEGERGRMMKRGEDPYSMTFLDYLEKYPWTERYTALSPAMRPGGRTARFTPSARRLF